MPLNPTDDPQLVLLRHGPTEWSQLGRYTGRTDIPLLPLGEQRAALAGETLKLYDFSAVYTSPLRRARDTAALAGYPGAIVDDDLMEWDYGPAEGLTAAELDSLIGHPYEIFADGVNSFPSHPAVDEGAISKPRGEDLSDVVARCRRFIAQVEPTLHDGGDVLAVAHGHLLRVLTMVWLDIDPRMAARFELGAACIGLLGYGHGAHTLEGWNI